MAKTRIVIPARMKSTRLPNKPLAKIGRKTLIEHVYQRASETNLPVTVLTDSLELVDRFAHWDIRITPESCATGTDRIAYMAVDFKEDVIINCQGDLPFIKASQLLDAADILKQSKADVATLVFDMDPHKQDDPNTVKAVCSEINHGNPYLLRAHWFVRAPLSYGYQHAGVYAYTKKTLLSMPHQRSHHEVLENLEQLRFLDHGYKVVAYKTTPVPPEVNTLEDLTEANKYLYETLGI
jgi:3-deoxy-manno-octulosonate cytidylyltransferase (CMP-KDO synthetase)